MVRIYKLTHRRLDGHFLFFFPHSQHIQSLRSLYLRLIPSFVSKHFNDQNADVILRRCFQPVSSSH